MIVPCLSICIQQASLNNIIMATVIILSYKAPNKETLVNTYKNAMRYNPNHRQKNLKILHKLRRSE
jgi:hypothetical protein